MVLTNPVLTPFPYPTTPLGGGTPLTYREGITVLGLIECLKDWIQDTVAPELHGALEKAVAEFLAGLSNAENTIIANKLEWQSLFDAFIANFEGEVKALNDHAISELVTEDSLTAAALDAKYAKISYVNAQMVLLKTEIETALNAAVSDMNTELDSLLGIVEANETDAENKFTGVGQRIGLVEDRATALEGGLSDLDEKVEEHIKGTMYFWAQKVRNQSTSPALIVNLGSSTANGGLASAPHRMWLNRLSDLYTDRPIIRLDGASVPSTPANGVQVYNNAASGTLAENYLPDSVIARIGVIKPHVIMHMIGINDARINITPTAYYTALRACAVKLKAASPDSVNVYFMQKEFTKDPYLYAWQEYLNAAKSVALEFGGIYKDFSDEFLPLGVLGTDRMGLMHEDGLHFEDDGNKVLFDIIAKFLDAPPINYINREVVAATGFVGGVIAPSTAVTVARNILREKPYIRQGTVTLALYASVISGVVDFSVSCITNDGAPRIIGEYRAPVNIYNHTATFPIELTANGRHNIYVEVKPQAGATLTISSNAQFQKFFTDVSPV